MAKRKPFARMKERMKRNRAYRDKLQDAKQDARFQRKFARVSKKNAKKLKKIYGDISPEEANEINKIQPYVGAMNEELNRQGVPVDDPEDTIEVAAKYNKVVNEDESIPEDVYEDAYVPSSEEFEALESGNHLDFFGLFKKREQNKSKVAPYAGIIAGAFQGGVDAIQRKKNSGQALTPVENEILATRNAMKQDSGKGNMAMLLIIILLVGVIVYRS